MDSTTLKALNLQYKTDPLWQSCCSSKPLFMAKALQILLTSWEFDLNKTTKFAPWHGKEFYTGESNSGDLYPNLKCWFINTTKFSSWEKYPWNLHQRPISKVSLWICELLASTGFCKQSNSDFCGRSKSILCDNTLMKIKYKLYLCCFSLLWILPAAFVAMRQHERSPGSGTSTKIAGS